ncbi:retrotransposon protein, putative, ty1-copia subclass [Tanacetum coccineum]
MTIKALRSDRGGEYISQEFKNFLKACGIVQQLTPPYTPQHNDVSERRNQTATRILNMVPTKKVDKTPYKLWYLKNNNGFYIISYFPPENKIVVARYAEFLEKNLLSQEISGRVRRIEEINTSEIPMEVEGFEPPQEEVVPVPAILDLESDKWVDTMNAKMHSVKDNRVWCLVDLPPNCKTVGSKWLIKKMTDMDNIVHTYKARLVAKGFTQTYGVDYEETFSPIADTRANGVL